MRQNRHNSRIDAVNWRLRVSSAPQCVFGDGEALGRFDLPRGCIAIRRCGTQKLCLHHIVNANPIDGMFLVEDYSIEKVLERGAVPGPYGILENSKTYA